MAPGREGAHHRMIPLAAAALQVAQLAVSPSGPYVHVADALAAARVAAGVYHERLTLEQPVVLLGAPGAVIEGDGGGTVILVRAPATIRGLTIRGSGGDQSREDSGILATGADGLVVEDNRYGMSWRGRTCPHRAAGMGSGSGTATRA
jgi:nitrous oxidase accessory protein